MSASPDKYVHITMSPILFGGDTKGLLDWMKLRGAPVSNQPEAWRVCAEERYHNRPRPGHFLYRRLAGPGQPDRIHQVLSQPVKGATVKAEAKAIKHVNKLGDQLSEKSQTVDWLDHFRLSVLVASDSQLPDVLKNLYKEIRNVPLSDDLNTRVLSNASVHLVEHDPALTYRLKFPSVRLRFDYDPRLAAGEIPAGHEAVPVVFASAFDLHSGMMMFDPYFGPLAGCLSPYIWCLIVPRSHGVVIIDFGIILNGTRAQAAELLDTLPRYGSLTATSRPNLQEATFSAAVAWWTEQLDTLFGVLSDPAVFAAANGTYRAAPHLHALLTIEQLFQRVISIQGAARDTHGSRVLLFSVLDTLERLSGRPVETHCSAEYATKTLDRLRTIVPESARDLLLWGPEQAVGALARVQDGFFLRSETGDQIVIRAEGEQEKWMTLDQAAAQYLKVLRDATHGHGSNRDNAKGKTNALLAQHDGKIPHEIAGLGFLYMLDILSRPTNLQSLLSNQARRS
ncbi:MAG: hypothetical protein ACRCYU_09755 [Nocardioides sp.]